MVPLDASCLTLRHHRSCSSYEVSPTTVALRPDNPSRWQIVQSILAGISCVALVIPWLRRETTTPRWGRHVEGELDPPPLLHVHLHASKPRQSRRILLLSCTRRTIRMSNEVYPNLYYCALRQLVVRGSTSRHESLDRSATIKLSLQPASSSFLTHYYRPRLRLRINQIRQQR
jgi:hypothetical protein